MAQRTISFFCHSTLENFLCFGSLLRTVGHDGAYWDSLCHLPKQLTSQQRKQSTECCIQLLWSVKNDFAQFLPRYSWAQKCCIRFTFGTQRLKISPARHIFRLCWFCPGAGSRVRWGWGSCCGNATPLHCVSGCSNCRSSPSLPLSAGFFETKIKCAFAGKVTVETSPGRRPTDTFSFEATSHKKCCKTGFGWLNE